MIIPEKFQLELADAWHIDYSLDKQEIYSIIGSNSPKEYIYLIGSDRFLCCFDGTWVLLNEEI